MPSLLTRTMLFLSSYSPLITILAIQQEDRLARGALLAVSVTAVAWLAWFVKRLSTLNRMRIKVVSAFRRDQDILGYLFAYVFPFIGTDDQKYGEAIALGVLFFVVAVLYVKLNAIYVNPLLALAGYYLHEVVEDNGKISMVLTRRYYIRSGSVLKVATAGTLVALEVNDDREP